MNEDFDLPLYLKSPADFRAYLGEQFERLNTVEKGERFAASVLAFVRAQDWAQDFPKINLNSKKSGELGRDIVSEPNSSGAQLFGESKYSLEGVEEFDAVLSKWHEVERQIRGKAAEEAAATLFTLENDEAPLPQFVLMAGVPLSGIRKRYEQQHRSSRAFYDDLQSAGRLRIYDLDDLYKWLRESYIKQHGIPSNFVLKSPEEWTGTGNVYIGAISGEDVVQLVDEHGEALFFENIRGWIGVESQVNSNIVRTIRDEPEKFLARNNGITLRAKSLSLSDDRISLEVHQGNIVNGCQTTMALFHSRPTSGELFVQVKVVAAEDDTDAWKIAESANYQNQVTLLELKLAQHLRPQLVARHATRIGQRMKVQEPNGLQSVLEVVSDTEVTYDFAKYLFLGLFSRRPNDLFADNYSKILGSVINDYYDSSDKAENELFGCLFKLIDRGRKAIASAAEALAAKEHSSAFARVFPEEGVKYQALVCLLAASAVLNEDLSDRTLDDSQREAQRLLSFVERLSSVLETDPSQFDKCCHLALVTLFNDAMRDNEDARKIKQYLSVRVREASFTRLYQALLRLLDLL